MTDRAASRPRARARIAAACLLLVAPDITDAAENAETLQIEGLSAPVEIVVDHWGIAHLYAENEADLFFAQGFSAARDRLFQFELWRRQATGTVAEILVRRELDHPEDRAAGRNVLLAKADPGDDASGLANAAAERRFLERAADQLPLRDDHIVAGQDRELQAVPEHHHALAQSLGARGPDRVLAERFEEAPAHEPRDRGGAEGTQGDGGQDEVRG